ncbi:proton-coupled folate transporter-like isoform X2 [Cimex lectularius]|nr:proton-coupled folate transporter-like isoform X2 [Cimex lectularius]
MLVKSILDSVVGIFLSFFIGPWMDTHGRKSFLVLPLCGYSCYYIAWLIFAKITTASPIYLLVISLIPMLSGGLVVLFAAVFSYVTDITTESNRGLRMTYLSTSYVLAVLLGYLISPLLLWLCSSDDTYTSVIYVIAAGFTLLVLYYVILCIPETVTFVACDDETPSLLQIFSFDSIKQMVKVVFVNREFYGLLIFGIICFVITIELSVVLGDSNFQYLILRKVLNWSMDDYNFYSASLCASSIVASLLVMWLFTKVLRVRELWVALLIGVMGCYSSICLGLSHSNLDFYLAGNLGVLKVIFSPAMKVEVSRIFPAQDMGKIFSIVSIIEAIAPLISFVCYTAVYDSVINDKPQHLSFLSASCWLLITLCLILIITIQHCKREDVDEDLLNPNEAEINHNADNLVNC